MRDNAKIKVGISVGDINGIGVEVILKTLSDNRMLDLCTPIIYAHKKVLTFYIKQLGIDKFNFLVAKSIDDINPKKVNLIQVWEEEVSVEPGVSNKEGGKYALLSLKGACAALQNKEIDLLCVPRATPYASLKKWTIGGKTAAMVSGSYCLSSNLYNPIGEGADLGGIGWIISPEGEIIKSTNANRPFVTMDIDINDSRKAKTTYPRYVKE